MKLAQYMDFYDKQASAAAYMDSVLQRMTESINGMTTAIDRAAGRMEALLSAVKKTGNTSADLKTPFNNLSNNLARTISTSKAEDISSILNPSNLVIGFAISVGWELFGDDIMTLLSPAMAILQAFAGLVHGVVAGLAPVLSLISGAIGGIAMALGYLGTTISVVQPILGGLAAGFGLLYVRTVAVTIAQKAQAVASKIAGAAQKILDLAINASPTMRFAAIIFGIITALISWMSATGVLKDIWASFINGVIGAVNGLIKLLNKIPWVNIDLIAPQNPVEDAKKAQQLPYTTPESTMPDPTMPMSYGPDYEALTLQMPDQDAMTLQMPYYDAMTPQMPDYGAGLNAAALNAEPLRVETVGTLEGVTGAVTVSEETMGGLGVMMAENRPQVTVAPNIVINATVREEADIRKLVSAIGRHLDEECRAGATGVYFGAGGRTVAL